MVSPIFGQHRESIVGGLRILISSITTFFRLKISSLKLNWKIIRDIHPILQVHPGYDIYTSVLWKYDQCQPSKALRHFLALRCGPFNNMFNETPTDNQVWWREPT